MDLLPSFPDEGGFLPCCFPTRGILDQDQAQAPVLVQVQIQITLTGPTRPYQALTGVQWRTVACLYPNYG